MRQIFNKIISLYLDRRFKQIENFMKFPHRVQEQVFYQLLEKGKNTEYGKKYFFQLIKNQKEYSRLVPLVEYEDLKQYIDKMMLGEKNILWPGVVKWFSKSSGTTSSKSKFIPVSDENLKYGHIKSSWDVVTLLYHNKPDSKIFSDKNLVMGGTLDSYSPFPKTMFGDISAIMLYNMPAVGRPFYTPDFETALLLDWNEKLEKMVKICTKENVTMFGGVPTWTIVLFNKILEYTGKSNMIEVWPNLSVYVHGGVGFEPYFDQFKKFVPSDQFSFLEVYNASEGYFGIQSNLKVKDMLLLLDNQVYYEFIPMGVWGTNEQYAIPLSETELGVNYAIVISTSSGLWRYQPGDTIIFTSLDPYRIKVTGRTKHFINVFGEELMVANTDSALATVCNKYELIPLEYHVAPVFFEDNKKGGHEWIIEFDNEYSTSKQFWEQFSLELDLRLQEVNSDYEAKRTDSLAMDKLKLNIVPKGTFIEWMALRGKLGGQHKIPRLSNKREYLEQILSLI